MTEPWDTPRDEPLPDHMLEKDGFELTPENWALVEPSPREISMGPWAVWREEGTLWEVEYVADMFGVTVEEVKNRLSEDGDTGVGSGDGGTGGGTAGDIGVEPVPIDRLGVDLDQGSTRMTVRKLDKGAVAAIREVIGASSDAEAVRKAVALAKDALVKG
jgi:hypothetical protein